MSASLGAALAARARARNPYGVNPNAEFQLGWEAAISAAPASAAPVVVADLEGLWECVAQSDEAGQDLALRDAGHRFWIIGGDEHGDHWATSFPHEDDEISMPCSFLLAPIAFPATIFIAPAPATAEKKDI